MIPNLYFNEETRSFSSFNDTDLEMMNEVYSEMDETREFGEKLTKTKEFLKSNPHMHAGLAGAGLGTTGTLIARKMAKKKALEMGLKPGTPEYKKFMAKYMAIGGAAGAAVGVGATYGGHTIAKLKKDRDKWYEGAKKLGESNSDLRKKLDELTKKREAKEAKEDAESINANAMTKKGGEALVRHINRNLKIAEDPNQSETARLMALDEARAGFSNTSEIKNYLFSDIDTRTFGKKWDATKAHLKKDMHVHAGLAAIGGAGLGTGLGYAMAKKAAIKAGLEPGTPEYKKFVAKRVAAMAGIGAGAGVAGAYGTHAGIAGIKAIKSNKGERVQTFKDYFKKHGVNVHKG